MSGWESQGNKDRILLTESALKIEFDIVMKTKRGAIFCAILKPKTKLSETELEVVDTSGGEIKLSYDRAHELLGHMGQRADLLPHALQPRIWERRLFARYGYICAQ